MKWAIGIMRVSNGYILKWYDEDEEDREFPQSMVIEEEEGGELKAAQKMLWEVLEYFGIYYSKHNKRNLVVKIEGNKDE